jgi:hypothetical protein
VAQPTRRALRSRSLAPWGYIIEQQAAEIDMLYQRVLFWLAASVNLLRWAGHAFGNAM